MNYNDFIAKVEQGLAILHEASEMADYDQVRAASEANKDDEHAKAAYLKTQFALVHLGDAKRSGLFAITRIKERIGLETQAANSEIHDAQRIG